MIVVIVLAAFAVMALAAIAGTGRFGEWSEPVNDRPKGVMPAGPVDEQFLHEVRIPTAAHGYQPGQVEEVLDRLLRDDRAAQEAQFDIVPRGYDMQFVDEILAQSGGEACAPEVTNGPIE